MLIACQADLRHAKSTFISGDTFEEIACAETAAGINRSRARIDPSVIRDLADFPYVNVAPYIFSLPVFPALRHAVDFASRLRAQIRCSRCRPPKLLQTGLEQAYANCKLQLRPSKRAPLRKRSSRNAAGVCYRSLHLSSPSLARHEMFAGPSSDSEYSDTT